MHIEESSLNKVTTRQVLIVDDDEDLCRMIAEYLSRRGWNVLAAHTGRRARELLRSNVVALILLDIGLPDCSGFDVLREFQRFVDTPVIVITARGEATDRIVGLELGADDYVVKPFSLRELLARMNAVARRCGTQKYQRHFDQSFVVEQFTVSMQTCQIWYRKGQMGLSAVEFQILSLLLQRAHEVCSRELLVLTAFHRPFASLDRSLDMHVVRLRRKLKSLPGFGGGIRAVRNRGYMLTLQGPKPEDT